MLAYGKNMPRKNQFPVFTQNELKIAKKKNLPKIKKFLPKFKKVHTESSPPPQQHSL